MLARAKINLTLHVGRALPEGSYAGYHPVESLVVFANFGDEIVATDADATGLSVGGPFGGSLSGEGDNLIIKALSACEATPQSVELIKNIPVSAGLGGGSANAAAILRAFDPDGTVDPAALGADVPVCRLSKTAMMEGIGERVTPLSGLGQISAVVANPGVAVSTADIFRAYDAEERPITPATTRRHGTLLERARSGDNDLTEIAMSFAPEIKTLIDIMGQLPGCRLSRMSGSGASVVGVFDNDEIASEAARRLLSFADRFPALWAQACRLGDDDQNGAPE